jgi:superfamily II DNA/RNA helicase
VTVLSPSAPVPGAPTVATFADLGVSAPVVERLSARGIDEPFPVQAATLPDALAGRDVCGRAPTGSGKTLAFGIPMVERVGKARPRRPRGLVLVPTRELANQVRDELVLLAGRKGPSVVTLFGGVGFGPQLSALRRGTDIAVACPGRLADLVNRGDIILDDVELVVLDEADRMADMGFLPEVKRLLDRVRPDRQTLLFSATLDGDVDVLVKRYQRKPARHEVHVDEEEPQNEYLFWRAGGNERTELTAEVVRRQWPAIVFVRTKRGADRLAQRLAKLGVTAAPIHGDRSQKQREAALSAFTRGKVEALVATDVAARGIHVDDVACVVHYDMPPDEKDFVHRSGRTGRAGSTGLVLGLVAGDQVADVRKMQRKLGLPSGVDTPDLALVTGESGDRPVRPRPVAPVEAPPARGRAHVATVDGLAGPGGNGSGRGSRRRRGAGRGRGEQGGSSGGQSTADGRTRSADGRQNTGDGRAAQGPRRAGGDRSQQPRSERSRTARSGSGGGSSRGAAAGPSRSGRGRASAPARSSGPASSSSRRPARTR